MREHLTMLLESAGFAVVATADTYAEGYRTVLAERPALAVLDNRLPDGRGVDLAAQLHREAPEVGIVIHSGAITAEEAEFARRSGALEVVTKDVRARPLVEALQRHATPVPRRPR